MHRPNKSQAQSTVVRWARNNSAILFLALYCIGCASLKQDSGSISNGLTKQGRPSLTRASEGLSARVEVIRNEARTLQLLGYKTAKTAGAGTVNVLDRQKVNTRATRYQQLAVAKAEAEAGMELIFKSNSAKAERINTTRRWLGFGGIAAGVGAAALIAASPANAVWVAAFSGFAGSIAGLNLVMENNGFSIASISQLENAAIEQVSGIYSELSLSELAAMVGDSTRSEQEFGAEAAKQEKLINRLKLVLLQLNVPPVKAAEVPAPATLQDAEISAL